MMSLSRNVMGKDTMPHVWWISRPKKFTLKIFTPMTSAAIKHVTNQFVRTKYTFCCTFMAYGGELLLLLPTLPLLRLLPSAATEDAWTAVLDRCNDGLAGDTHECSWWRACEADRVNGCKENAYVSPVAPSVNTAASVRARFERRISVNGGGAVDTGRVPDRHHEVNA
jgi:hypothetical protein